MDSAEPSSILLDPFKDNSIIFGQIRPISINIISMAMYMIFKETNLLNFANFEFRLHTISGTKKKEVIDLFKDGLKQVEIVKQTHLGRTTIHSILKAAGVK